LLEAYFVPYSVWRIIKKYFVLFQIVIANIGWPYIIEIRARCPETGTNPDCGIPGIGTGSGFGN